ncbi:GspH/FimT family pseudopilin [Amphritea sp.]|uniref:GspH/FimT family pseudopilin n=1 Tax=Amphritea sp. TaxID=1872502 RepID=UPI003A8EEE8A
MKQTGFTLIELMVTLVVLGILLGVGIPSFNSVIESNTLRAVAHSVNTATQLARSEALDKRTNAAVCRANAAFTACQFGADWSSGWVVVTQQGADLETAADVTVVRMWEAVAITVSGAANGLVFERSGRATTTGSIQIQNSSDSRCLSVNGSGSTALQEGVCP